MINYEKKGMRWTGRILSALGALFMAFDVIVHLLRPPIVTQSFLQMGYSLNVIVPIAIIELIFVVLYIIPRTSVLGAILLTGYLGGAVDANVRAGNPLFSYVLSPVYVAIVLWAGLYLRDSKIRSVLPFEKRHS